MWLFELISNSTALLLVFFISLLIPSLIIQWLESRKYPPGPIGLPIIGYVPFLGNNPHKKLYELTKKYGKVMSVKFGSNRVIVISDYKLAKEALTHAAALGRPHGIFNVASGNGGFLGLNGEEWQEERRFVMRQMRDLGLGRGVWESIIQEYAEEFAQEISKFEGKPCQFVDLLTLSMAGNILALLVGRRLPKDKDDSEVRRLLSAVESIIELSSSSSINMIAPFLTKYLALFRIAGYDELVNNCKGFGDQIKLEIQRHKNNVNGDQPTDFLSCYLEEIEKPEQSNKIRKPSVESLIGNALSLFAGGSDTTTTSLRWLFLIISSYPEVQVKIHEEIDNVVGRDKRVFWDERHKLPYTTATILEAERWAYIVPLYPPRLVEETFTLGGYTIPKGSQIMCNGYGLMNDPDQFPNPREFRPERFLNEEKRILKPESYIPFSIGKRNCPGETVAMMSIFSYFVTLMQKFQIKSPDGKPVSMEAQVKGVISPKFKQPLCFIERQII